MSCFTEPRITAGGAGNLFVAGFFAGDDELLDDEVERARRLRPRRGASSPPTRILSFMLPFSILPTIRFGKRFTNIFFFFLSCFSTRCFLELCGIPRRVELYSVAQSVEFVFVNFPVVRLLHPKQKTVFVVTGRLVDDEDAADAALPPPLRESTPSAMPRMKSRAPWKKQ